MWAGLLVPLRHQATWQDTLLYMLEQGYTLLYMLVHGCTWLHTSLCGCTWLHTALHPIYTSFTLLGTSFLQAIYYSTAITFCTQFTLLYTVV